MANTHLATYLNDHLSGAVLAIELMKHVEHRSNDEAIRARIAGVRAEVERDRAELKALIEKLDLSASVPRRIIGWLSERMAELKLRLDDPFDGSLHLYEAVELLSIGIEGKAALWRALSAVAPQVPGLSGMDYNGLIRRASEQRETLEPTRLYLAGLAVADGTSKTTGASVNRSPVPSGI